jgi:1-acyl-sn-glycerol-3-phosphate acyltransferase
MNIFATLRSLLMLLLYPFVLVPICVVAIGGNLLFNNKDFDDRVALFWGQISCWMFGVKVLVRGRENIPAGGCIFLFNHTSFFDIFAMQGAIRGFRFGAKIELFKIPIFGATMTRMGALPIARHRRDEVFRVYTAAQERIARGEKFALAPEGTRQTEERLGEFKAGPFVFGINAKAPLVPVVIRGAAAIMPKNHWLPNKDVWVREITIDILPAVSTDGYDVKDRPLLQSRVRAEMEPFFTASAQ